jgi:hypothetical protein
VKDAEASTRQKNRRREDTAIIKAAARRGTDAEVGQGPDGLMRLVAACVTPNPTKTSPFSGSRYPIHFVTQSSSRVAAPRGTIDRVRLIAELRNDVMEKAMQWSPSHVLMIDDYYLDQVEEVELLLDEYGIRCTLNSILGASTWVKVRWSTILKKNRFYDVGTTPEAKNLSLGHMGLIPVRAVGACYIFPVEAWKTNGYTCNPEKFEPEHVGLCRGYSTFLDLNVKLWRHDRTDAILPLSHSTRVAVGRWRRKICAR